ncbi:MAG: hypothetical protein HYS12_29920 [Planctomycetes bacterium]|nr:hypothetical protein [Planctomycetota bacterium]
MLRLSRWFAVALLAFAPLSAHAQTYCPPVVVAPVATVRYYTAAPTVTYYAPAPVVAYASPVVTAYASPVVTTYASPVVTAYAAPAPVSVSTYRYGLFGRRSVTTVNYGAPVVGYAAPIYTPRRVTYYTPAVIYP